MAYTNIQIYNLVKFLINKEAISSYINVNDFNLLLNQSNILLLKEKLGLSNDYQLLAPVSRKQKGLSTISDDEIRQFKVKGNLSFSSGIASLPNNYFKYDTIRVSGALEPVEVLSSGELSKRLSDAIDAPDAEFPAAEIIGSSVYIYPTTITAASLVYYRYPNAPSISYYVDADGNVIPLAEGVTYMLQSGEIGSGGETAGNNIVSTTVEHQWGEECAIELGYIIAKNLGVNVSRADVFQASDKIIKEGI